MKRSRLLLGGLALGLLSVAFLAGCGSGGFSEKSGKAAANVLRYPIPNNPTSLDPATVQDGDTLDLLIQVYEGLVGWGPNNEVVGLLAESWEVSPDGLTYTFKLRDAKFHNGRTVTAEDIKWSIERAADPKMASPTIEAYLSDIKGLSDMVQGRATSIEGIKVIDEKTVSITLNDIRPYFLGKLTYLVAAAVPKEIAPMGKQISSAAEMVGTGPFKMKEWQDKQLAVLSRNDEYWGGAPKLETIERPVVLDANTRLNLYLSGEVDMIQLQRQDLKGVLDNPEIKDHVVKLDRAAIWYVGMSQLEYAPFKDKRVRQAFAMAIDRENIVNVLMGGVNTPAYTILPPAIPGHREKGKGPEYNVEKAKALLAEAGYPGGKGLPPLNMTHREGYPDIKLVAEAVAGQIKSNLGVDVRVSPQEWGKYLEDYNNKKQVFYHMRWSADFLDPQNFLSHMLTTTGPENKFGWSNPEFDALCAKADRILNMEERLPLYAQAEDIALEEAVWIPIFYQRDIELHRPGLTGIRKSVFGHLPHTTTEVKR